MNKIMDFKDLITWQHGHLLVTLLFKRIDTWTFTAQRALGDQLRRAIVSVTSNIAEGFGRRSLKEKLQFYYIAQGSLIETKNQLIIAKDVGYISKETFSFLYEEANITHKLLQGLITKTKQLLNS